MKKPRGFIDVVQYKSIARAMKILISLLLLNMIMESSFFVPRLIHSTFNFVKLLK